MRSKRRVLMLLLLVLVVFGAVFWWLQHDKQEPAGQNATSSQSTPETKKTIRLIATGDMLPHDTVNKQAKTSDGYDYLPMFSEVKPYLLGGDMAYCNQESPTAPGFSVSGYPTFNAPTSFASDLNQVGCNVINLANNHADDKGQSGIDQTRQVWDGFNTLAVAGTARSQAEQDKIAYFEKDGIRFAFLSYSQCSNNKNVTSYGLNLLSEGLVSKQITEAKQHSDMIIGAMHACREGISAEDSDQDAWAQYFADHGVDIVIGTGPHWLQPVKRLPRAGGGTTVVWFSLGNFLSSQEEVNGLIGGIAYMDIDIASKTVSKLSFMPTYMHYEWSASEKASGNLLARKNLKLYPLDQAAGPLGRSQNETTVEAQTTRVTELLNKYTPVTMLTSKTAPR